MTIKLSMRDGTTREFHNVYQLIHVGKMIMIPTGIYEYEAIHQNEIVQIHPFHLEGENEQTHLSNEYRSKPNPEDYPGHGPLH